MTKDTYLCTVTEILKQEPMIVIHDSERSKLTSLGREVERGRAPRETVADITDLFSPWVGRHLREALERALR